MMFMFMMFMLIVMVTMVVRVLVAVGRMDQVPVATIGMIVRRDMHVELNSGDAGLMPAGKMYMVAAQWQLFELALQLMLIYPQVNQGSDEHVAADSAEYIEV